MKPYEFLRELWEEIYFKLAAVNCGNRAKRIEVTTGLILYFLVAHTEKNIFIITVNKFLRKAGMRKDFDKIREAVFMLYRLFFTQKKIFEKEKIQIGTQRQVQLLKMEAELFTQYMPAMENQEFLDLWLEEMAL